MSISDSDKNIIAGCIKGSESAWQEFVRRFSGLVGWSIKSCLRRFGFISTGQDIEDIHQEVFLSIYKNNKLRQLKDASKIAGWLAVVAANVAIDYMRGAKAQAGAKTVSLFEPLSESGEENLTLADICDSKDAPVNEEVDKKLKLEILRETIDALPSKEKIILNLYFTCGNAIKEIANLMDMPQGSIATVIARAKEKIKKRVNKNG